LTSGLPKAHDEGGDLDPAMTRVTNAVAVLVSAIQAARLAADVGDEYRRTALAIGSLASDEKA
jgi:hypothetical protein